MKWIAAILIFAACVGVRAATWYVDIANDGGTENGTSWATAWGKPSDVVWASISAGDTIYLSDGTYTTGFSVGKSGTALNPIVIKKAQDVGHSGVATFQNVGIADMNGHDYITFDGALDDNFVAPTNHQQVISGATAITNNIGFKADNGFVGFFGNSPMSGFRAKWIELTRMTNHPSGLGSSHGFSFAIGSAGAQVDNIIEYCHVTGTGADAVQWTGGSVASGYDEKVIRFCWFHDFGDDGFEANHGLTVSDSVIGPSIQLSGHADFFQTAGEYHTIKNNLLRQGGLNSFMRIQAGYGSGSTTENFGNVRVYNNLFVCEQYTGAGYPSPANPVEFVNYNPQNANANVFWRNVVFANNTVWGYTNDSSTFFSWNMSFGTSGGVSTNAYITNSIWANNLFFDVNKGVGANWVSDNASPPYGMHYGANDLIWDWNTVAATNSALDNPKRMSYRGTAYATGEALSAAEIWTHNNSTTPKFADLSALNFELASDDTAALNTGTNLSSIFTTDGLNRPRNVGAWDRGAFELQSYTPPDGVTNGLLVLLSFDEDFTSAAYVTDWSGNENHAYKFGFPANPLTNAPLRVATSTTPGRTGDTGYAGGFDWFADGYGFYGRSGRFLAITNQADFEDLGAMTVMAWARYYAPHSGEDYSSDANAVLVSGSLAQGTVGAWALGRYNQSINLNETRFTVNTNGSFGQAKLNYPENGFEGTTTNWHHYAATFSAGTVILYFDGVAISTNALAPTTLTLSQSPSRPYDWIGIGANPHVGTPELEDETGLDYPNNGWMNGVIDDVRIYNRAVNADEVAAIVSGDLYEEGGGDVETSGLAQGAPRFMGGAILR
jgi:hypothetical protein